MFQNMKLIVFILVGYKPDKIIRDYDNKIKNFRGIKYLTEKKPMGTGVHFISLKNIKSITSIF